MLIQLPLSLVVTHLISFMGGQFPGPFFKRANELMCNPKPYTWYGGLM